MVTEFQDMWDGLFDQINAVSRRIELLEYMAEPVHLAP